MFQALGRGGVGRPEHLCTVDNFHDCIFHLNGAEVAELPEAVALHHTANQPISMES